MNESAASINAFTANLMVEELVRCGVTNFVLSPGSRCTPLTLAVAENERTNHIMYCDERGAAFYALGQARATGKPTALVCTSGTAAANYYPAIIEASMDMIPLIVLTADRPPELRATGANQSIDQVGMYGNYIRWQFDFPCPTTEQSPECILTTIDQAVYRASLKPAGPVHLNCMFREPLAPPDELIDFSNYLTSVKRWMNEATPYTSYSNSAIVPNENEFKSLMGLINETEHGLVVLGKLTYGESRAAIELVEKLGWPVLPDISSGIRLGTGSATVVPHHDLLLVDKTCDMIPETVLHIGGRLTSKRLLNFLKASTIENYIHVADHPFRLDPDHSVTHKVTADIFSFCHDACQSLPSGITHRRLWGGWTEERQAHIETVLVDEIDKSDDVTITEPMIARVVSQEIMKEGALFLSSSMPVRDMNMFADRSGSNVPVGCNRGASGIDGVVATACGFANRLNKATTLLIGDLALLHDLNSLSLTRNLDKPLVIIVMNNNGGGIFSFLPIAERTKMFEPLFGTPHGINFAQAASMFGLEYVKPANRKSFVSAYKLAQQSSTSTIIEVTTDRSKNVDDHQQLQVKIASVLSEG